MKPLELHQGQTAEKYKSTVARGIGQLLTPKCQYRSGHLRTAGKAVGARSGKQAGYPDELRENCGCLERHPHAELNGAGRAGTRDFAKRGTRRIGT